MSELENTPQVNFTDACAIKVFSLIQEEDDSNLSLRVYISGGGCSGFQYGFMFDDTINEDDQVITKQVSADGLEGSVKLLIDVMSFQYLQGATIDYREDVSGSQFVIRNPNAKTTCGCGSSFSVE